MYLLLTYIRQLRRVFICVNSSQRGFFLNSPVVEQQPPQINPPIRSRYSVLALPSCCRWKKKIEKKRSWAKKKKRSPRFFFSFFFFSQKKPAVHDPNAVLHCNIFCNFSCIFVDVLGTTAAAVADSHIFRCILGRVMIFRKKAEKNEKKRRNRPFGADQNV